MWGKQKGCISNREILLLESIPQLKITLFWIKNKCKSDYEPFFCVVYSRHTDAVSVENNETLARGNSNKTSGLCRPYIRTKLSVLKRQHVLLSFGKRTQEVYNITLEESGGPLNQKSHPKNQRTLSKFPIAKARLYNRRCPPILTTSTHFW